MKKEDLSNYEHNDGMEQFLSYIKKKATHHEESVALIDFFYRLRRKPRETMSAWINRSDFAYQKMLDKLRDGDDDHFLFSCMFHNRRKEVLKRVWSRTRC